MRGDQGRLLIAAVGGVDRRSAEGADTPMNPSREARHPARPLHSPESAYNPGRFKPTGDRPSSDQAIPCRGTDPTERPTRSTPRVGRTLQPDASAGYDAHG